MDPAPVSIEQDGVFYKRVTELADGSWALMAECCCDGDVQCGEMCAPRCAGPGCTILQQGLGIPCIDLQVTGWDLINRWCPSPSGLLETLIEVHAYPSRFRLYNQSPGSQISTDFLSDLVPILITETTREVANPSNVTQVLHFTTVRIRCNVWHCISPDGLERCPMTSFVRFVDVPGQLRIDGFAQSIGTDPYFFGFEIENEAVPLGCPPLPPNNPNGRFPFRLRPLIASQSVSCGAVTNYYLWKRCGGSETISVDLDARPDGAAGVNVLYQGQLYVPTGEQTDIEPVTVIWTDQACEVWPVLALCTGGPFRLPYDPELRPPDAVTAIWSGFRMSPVNETVNAPPVPVEWSTEPCPSNGGPCSGLVPNDSRCNDPQFRDCPQCVGFDAGDPDVIPTDPRGSTPPDNNGMIEALMSPIMRCKGCGG